MRLFFSTLLVVFSVVVGCSLPRTPLLDQPAMDAGRDAPRPGIDAPGEDVPFVEPDVPMTPDVPVMPDAGDPCMRCPTGTRCMSTDVCQCDATLCESVGECVAGGACEACGHLGERCCSGDECGPGTRCMGGSCVESGGPCGGIDQACCDGTTCEPSSGAECIGGMCVTAGGSCGGPDEACCSGACVTGTSCQWTFGGTRCQTCGNEAGACCPFGPPCNGSLMCRNVLGARICSRI